ncbi:MAG: hypothetical protein QXE01_04195 [Sulfolobales archaeon]
MGYSRDKRHYPRERRSRYARGYSTLVLSLAFLVLLIVYLADIAIPIGSIKTPRYSIEASKILNISIDKILFNEAYPIPQGSNITIYLRVGSVRTSIGNISFEPGKEIRPNGSSTLVEIQGEGPWNIYVFDESIGREILAGVIYKSSDLLIQTGAYTALLSISMISKLNVKIESSEDVELMLRLRYINRSSETIDLGVCSLEKGSTCFYSIERSDLSGYEALFYIKTPLLKIRIIDGSLIISPYENPQIFIPAIVITFSITIVAVLRRHGKRRSKGRSMSLIRRSFA